MKRSKHSLSNYKLLSCDMGELVPIGLTEVLPGDTIQQSTSALIRVSPLLAPVMHPVNVRIHHWFVPHRLVWDDFEDFITGGPDGMDESEFPYFNTTASTGMGVGTLSDYLGVPTGVPDLSVSALPYRGYQLIFNEWYRDQDLTTEAVVSKASGEDNLTSRSMKNVCWEKDYFTSARPWTQKGPEITIPLGTTAPVVSDGTTPNFSGNLVNNSNMRFRTNTVERLGTNATIGSDNSDVVFGNNTGLETDLTNASAANINELRRAFALQRYEEARAQYGSRYTEYLRYFGIRSSDARLQRPEYLGGGKQTIQFSEVLQSAPTTDGDDSEGVGNLKGHGIGALRSNRYRRFFEEHGYIFTLLSVRPKTIYAQGLPRHWSRRTKEDFWQKELQHIGQQEVYNKEVYAAHSSPNGVLGYIDRYDEYRRIESSIAGQFRTDLDFWHMARIFSSDPALNSTFVTCNPTKRINAVQTEDVLWIMANHSIQARRMVSKEAKSFIY